MTNDGKDSADSQCDEFLEVPFILILDKNIEKSACLRRLKPFFESLLALLGANSPSAKFAKGLRIPRAFKKEIVGDAGW